MGNDLGFRSGTTRDLDQILDLMKISLGEGEVPRHREYWKWKHDQNPFGSSPVLLAVSGSDVVGLRVFMRWTWQVDGQSCAAVRAVDTATHPDWRGQGIFSRLTVTLLEQMRAEGVAFVFNTPNDKSRPGYLKMGWQKVGRVSVWGRPMRPAALVAAGRHVLGPGSAPAAPAVSFHQGGSSTREIFDDPALPGFLEAVRPPLGDFSTPRTLEYLRWRYGRIPGIEYRAASNIQGSRGAAVVFRIKQRGQLRELRFSEVLVGSGRVSREIARRLLRSVVAEADADYAGVMAPVGTTALSLYPRLGFLPVPRSGPLMTVRRLQDEIPVRVPVRRSDWHLSIGDLELF